MSASDGALKHHFEDIEQQRGAERLGMWMFLATEILFFGGIFMAYTVYRHWYAKRLEKSTEGLRVLVHPKLPPCRKSTGQTLHPPLSCRTSPPQGGRLAVPPPCPHLQPKKG